jgi:hypothetical protein
MDWRLLETARDAENVASGLQIFLDEVPSWATEISACIAEFFAISSALRHLDGALELPRYIPYHGRIARDASIVFPSLEYTMEDVRDMFSKTGVPDQVPGAFPELPKYRMLWEDLDVDMKNQGASLCPRLEMYRVFTLGLLDILRGYRALHTM